MISKMFKGCLVAGAMIALFSFDLPKGWFKAGSAPAKYDMGIARGQGHDSKNAATIKSNEEKIEGEFGTLMQNMLPDKYIGKRVRMSGYMKSANVTAWAGLWLRVDGRKQGESLSFDNMQDRGITGTTDWKKYEIVLDVPQDATNVAFGALIDGTGQIWFDDIQFEIVPPNVPTTDMVKKSATSSNRDGQNLNFEE